MGVIKSASIPTRALIALLLGLLLGVRLLSPAGFMPAFDRGALTIVICPDADPAAPATAGHHHHKPKQQHQPCPYAAGSAVGALANDVPLVAALLVIGLALLLGRPFAFLERHRSHERPPSRGPPLPA